MTTTVDPRIALMSRLNTPPYDEVAGMRGTPLGEAVQLLDAYRASVLRDAADRLSMDWGGPDHEDGMDEARQQLRRMAEEAEASDG